MIRRRRFRFRLSGGALVVQERFRVRKIPFCLRDLSDLSGVRSGKKAEVSDISLSRWVTAKYEGMGEIMGFWDSAIDEAGKEYGRRHAERIARWQILRRSAGYAAVAGLVAAGVIRAYVPAPDGTAVRYGLGAVVLFGGTVLLLYAVVRTVRAHRRTTRAVRYSELYSDRVVQRSVQQRPYRTDDVYETISYDGTER